MTSVWFPTPAEGVGYYSMLAKSTGIALANVSCAVITSDLSARPPSPLRSSLSPVSGIGDLAVKYMEQATVAMAPTLVVYGRPQGRFSGSPPLRQHFDWCPQIVVPMPHILGDCGKQTTSQQGMSEACPARWKNPRASFDGSDSHGSHGSHDSRDSHGSRDSHESHDSDASDASLVQPGEVDEEESVETMRGTTTVHAPFPFPKVPVIAFGGPLS